MTLPYTKGRCHGPIDFVVAVQLRAWRLGVCSAAGSAVWQRLPDAVEADITLNDRQSIVVQVAVTYCDRQIAGCQRHVPSVFRIYVITGKNATTGKFESAELGRMSDLPHFLRGLRETSN